MVEKGLVLKINRDSAIVLTRENNYVRIVRRDGLSVGSKILYSDSDVIKTISWRMKQLKGKKTVAAAVIALVLVCAGLLGANAFRVNELPPVAATVVTVDINPSFKLSVDEGDLVLQAEALNDDAKTITLTDIAGMRVEDAVELLVQRAKEAGFIDTEDLEDDFVLVSAIDMDESEDDNDAAGEIMDRLRDKSEDSDVLKEVNLAMIEATVQQLQEAQRLNIPVGLYAVNGGEVGYTVKEFFADNGLAQQFMSSGEVIENSFEHQLSLMAAYIDLIEADGTTKEDLQSAFEASKMDFFEAKRLFKEAQAEYKEAVESGDEEQIAAAKAILEKAEAFKDLMEQNKDSVEAIKEILKGTLEGEENPEDQAAKEQEKADEAQKRLAEKAAEAAKRAEEAHKRLEEKAAEAAERADEAQKRLEEKTAKAAEKAAEKEADAAKKADEDAEPEKQSNN